MASAATATKPVDAAKPAKRTTRSTLRHSLNLASMGKALADVMNKEGNGTPRRRSVSGSNAKDASLSKRATTVGFNRKSNVLGTVPEGLSKMASPDQTTVTTRARRPSSSLQRPGGASSGVDETGMKVTSVASPQSGTLNRTGPALRPRSTVGSGLPKYRPKSMLAEAPAKRPLSSVLAGTRRKHSSSEEEKDSSSISTRAARSTMPKAERPISPIPRRSSSIRVPSPARSDTSKSSQRLRNSTHARESSITSTPPRPKKTQKPSLSPVLKKTSLPRPSPRSSPVTTSGSPQTPASARSAASRYLSEYSSGRESPSPLRTSFVANKSPSRKRGSKAELKAESESNQNTPTAPQPKASPKVISMNDPTNESIDDIELMLAEVASPSAPTPAIPRINTVFHPPAPREQHEPETPSKPSLLQSRSSMLSLSVSSQSYNSMQSQPTSRQQSPERRPAALRNSIAAWNRLADMSLEINAAELGGGLITELDLPSTPGLVSPSPSMLRLDSEMGESPAPLTIPSPGGYTSISQVLLPAVTPSPAPMRTLHSSSFYDEDVTLGRGELPGFDTSAATTMLKLQLAQAEKIANDRLSQVSRLEEQMQYLKQMREREELELASHINELEERLRDTLLSHERDREQRDRDRIARAESEARDADSDPHEDCRTSLEEYMREAEQARQDAVSAALTEFSARERTERARMCAQLRKQQKLGFVVRDVLKEWQSVQTLGDSELEALRGNRETLSVLRGSLDMYEAQLRSGRCVSAPFPLFV